MADQFDPYHRWLGIPPKHQPADHYRLLGLERFEDDLEVIVDAAERQTAHVRRYALGPNQILSQKILNELAAAQSCLMDPVEKARYDGDLRQRQAASTPQAAPSPLAAAPVVQQVDIPPVPSAAAAKLVKLQTATSQRPTAADPVRVSRDVVRWLDERLVAWAGPRFPVPLGVLRGLAVGVPLGLAIVGLLVAVGMSTNHRPVDTGASRSGAGAIYEPIKEPAPEPTVEPVVMAAPESVVEAVLEPAPEPTVEPIPASSAPLVTRPPRIRAIPDQIIDEGVPFQVRVDVDSDEPLVALRFHLEPGFPAGMVFDEPQRMVIWTPDESQGPGEYSITVVATISVLETILVLQSRELRESFRIGVREVNTAPSIVPITDQVIESGKEVAVLIEVRDDDAPANELTISLLEGPPGAVIDSEGRRFNWTPEESHAGRAWPVTIGVRDNGEPAMEAQARFTIRVTPPPKPASPPLAVAPFDAAQAKEHQAAWSRHLGQPVEVSNSIGMKLILIPPGEFLMGSPDSETGRSADETQQHVRITKPYYMGVYEVTQGEYARVMGINPSWFSRTNRGRDMVSRRDTSRFPVEQVSWAEALVFCRRLSTLSAEQAFGRAYRLPTEAEWEYSCRAGTTTPFHLGSELNGREANCNGNSPYGMTGKGTYLQRPAAVASYGANGFGLYDAHGNVWEWCSDWYGDYAAISVDDPQGPTAGSDRVFRGGGWDNDAWRCRSANRSRVAPVTRNPAIGFRLAFSLVDGSGR